MDCNGSAVANAGVTLWWSAPGTGVATARSDRTGNFYLSGIPKATDGYEWAINASGFQVIWERLDDRDHQQFDTGTLVMGSCNSEHCTIGKGVNPGDALDQSNRGESASPVRVSGHIIDPSGGVIPRSTVTLKDAAGVRNIKTFQTGANGAFSFSAVLPGTYDLRVVAQGFRPLVRHICVRTELEPGPLVLDLGSLFDPVAIPGGRKH